MQILLTQGKCVEVDEADYESLAKFKWCANMKKSSGKPYWYAVRNIYPNGKHKPVLIYMHRVITDAPSDRSLVVDHVNGNTLDNRRSNLRIVDRATNLSNKQMAIP